MTETSDHDDLISATRAAVEQHREPEPVGDYSPVEPEHVAVADVADQITARLEEQQPSGRPRDERGKFVSSKADAPTQVQTEDYNRHRRQDLPRYTNGWPDAARADYDKATPALKAAIEKREFETSEGFRQYSERLKPYEQVEAALAPKWENYARQGFQNPGHVFQHLLEVSDRLQQDPQTAVQLALSLPPQHQAALRQAFGGQQAAQFSPQQLEHIQRMFDEEVKKGIEAGLKQERQQQARVAQKVRASGASLSGGPYGAQSAPLPNGHAKGSFNDIASDVRAAMNSLGI